MKKWIKLNIDVDYSPSDPGINNWFCDRTSFEPADLTPGKTLYYKDSGGLFGTLTLVRADADAVVLRYGQSDITLREGHSSKELDNGGRNYTRFYLNVWLSMVPVIEDSPAFYRQWTAQAIRSLTEEDIRFFQESELPAAKYVLGRWHCLTLPEGAASRTKADRLLREAADAGVPDAVLMLSTSWALGETVEDRMDLEESARLRDRALGMGSILAQLRYARNRVAGVWLAPEEPAVVAQEIETRLREESDPLPEWYSILGYAHETLGHDSEAEAAYRKGMEAGCVRCYGELALFCWERGRKAEFDTLMQAGMRAGCGYCFTLGHFETDEEFEAFEPSAKAHFVKTIVGWLERGLALGESICAEILGTYHLNGRFGLEKDWGKAAAYLEKGALMGDSFCCSLLADLLEEGEVSEEDRRDAAVFRLRALRYGESDPEVKDKMLEAYRDGLLDRYQDEIEQYWVDDDDCPDDDGRYDAYA